MLKDLEYKDPRSFGLKIYHKYVAQSMSQGFRWVRYGRNGDTLWISDLRNYPGVRSSVTSRECADRYERWYKWMKLRKNQNRKEN